MKCGTRKHQAPYGLEEVELRQEGQKLDAAGTLYVPLTESKVTDPATPSSLSVGTPGDRRSLPVENRFKEIKLSQEREKVWTKPSVKLEKKWSWGLCPTREQ